MTIRNIPVIFHDNIRPNAALLNQLDAYAEKQLAKDIVFFKNNGRICMNYKSELPNVPDNLEQYPLSDPDITGHIFLMPPLTASDVTNEDIMAAVQNFWKEPILVETATDGKPWIQ